ncbi:Uncharacterised protein [Serratia quinivorans]|uniref:hypothetical protein n=1 Tax=Serratia quinivorans TaxID=137545 RepID=UPI00217B9EF3|nr:hypothetical protein [Serratia quinivorans]CAI2062170.1 Uncharacterised protein [Serratia quinivorans]
MSNEDDIIDVTNNFLIVHDISVSHLHHPNTEPQIIFTIDYDRKDGEQIPDADQIINCITPDSARQLIELLQQSLDALENEVPTFSKVQKH